MVDQLLQASGVPIDHYSFETVETMKDRAMIWNWHRDLLVAQARLAGVTQEEAEARVPKVTFQRSAPTSWTFRRASFSRPKTLIDYERLLADF